ncbi:EAL domain-containing protein [Noviherbaspirillum sp. UKPF54]|uniref:bifunctional diguanylate cyclase/phosphodiesterase n=1 Tax=Noviherbaspirillum sp. UKPF54 TaxID=2601898 RepID=UPI0011B11C17|nr:EAL domain-containing protein [Noviherbaspirillum sp. UKPF54]QDZ28965.1 EAL domain-containing protein [Noviherbaspirillum sp. UKPF54]
MTTQPKSTPVPATSGATGFLFNPVHQLLILFGLLLSAIWAVVYFQTEITYARIMQAARSDGSSLSRAFAEQVKASVRGIDLSLISLRETWMRNPADFHEAVHRQQNYFVREMSFQVAVIDAAGMLVYSSLDPGSKPVSLADREHFQVHRERRTDQLFISKPVFGRVSNRWSVQFTRPILGPDNRFLGVVVMSVSPENFARVYDTFASPQQGVVVLLKSSGEILARSPHPEVGLGKTLVGRPYLGPQAMESGSFQDRAQTDFIERIYSWRRLKDLGLVVLVGQTVDHELVPYYRQRNVLVASGIAGSALLGICTFLVILGIRQRVRATAALRTSEERSRLRVVALEKVGNAVVVTNTRAEIEWVNRAFEELTGYTRDEAFGRRIAELLKSGEQDAQFYKDMWRDIQAGKTWRGELVNRRKDGSLYHEELVITPVKAPAGAITQFVGIKQDISDRKYHERALRQSHELLAKLSSHVPGVIFQYRVYPDGRVAAPFISQALWDIYELNPEQVREDASAIGARHHPEDAEAVVAALQRSARTLEPWHQEYRVLLPRRGERWLLGDARPERLEDGSVQWHGAITDITDSKQAEEQLRVAAVAFESQEGMVVTDARGRILRVNRAFEDLTGYSATDAIGQTPAMLKSGRQDADFYRQMWADIELKGHWEGEVWNRKKSGDIYPEWLVITAVKDRQGRVTHYVGAFFDITTRKNADAQIRNLAFFDPLTSLPNRRLLTDRVTQALAASARNGHHGALMLIDLDHFKTLNDTLGHDVGDQLLIQVAQRLTASVRECDTVARLGGDEFVVMLQDLSGEEATAAMQIETVVEKILAALGQPYPLKGVEGGYRNTPSIGISQFRGHDEPFDVLLKQADIALYKAKEAGRNTSRFYSAEMQAALNEKAALEAGLREALAADGFELHYQPQVDEAYDIVGVEALLRWPAAAQPPARFIAIAEETGLIHQIGQWVMETACAQLAAWSGRPETSHLTMAVNVSAKQFRQPGFVPMVRAALVASGADPALLKLELTETTILGDVDEAIGKMRALRELGIRFALDDFGTGYSSLSYLRRLPVDQVKIDQSFMRDLTGASGGGAIVQAIIGMSRTLDLQVIAEGVETQEQLAFLAAHRCRHFQGFLFGHPAPAARIEEMLATRRPDIAQGGVR